VDKLTGRLFFFDASFFQLASERRVTKAELTVFTLILDIPVVPPYSTRKAVCLVHTFCMCMCVCTVHSESRCELIQGVGSDVHEP
jgi:hypothetical protein